MKNNAANSPPKDDDASTEAQTAPNAKTRARETDWRKRIGPVLAKLKDRSRSVITVALAGLAAYLISILISIPTTRSLEPLIAAIDEFYPFWRVFIAALVLDLPKGITLLIMAFPFGRLVAIKGVAAALGLGLTVYLADFGVGWVVGSFEAAWGHRYALMSRIPLALLFLVATTLLVCWGQKSAGKRNEKNQK